MAREALLELNCSRYSEKIIDIINLLCKVGGYMFLMMKKWSIYQ